MHNSEHIEDYSFSHGRHFNVQSGQYSQLLPHDLGRPLTHEEMDYNLLFQTQTVSGYRIFGSAEDLSLDAVDSGKVLKFHQIAQDDVDYMRYVNAGYTANQFIWVPVDINEVPATTTTTTIPTTTTSTTTTAPTTTTTTTAPTTTTTTTAPTTTTTTLPLFDCDTPGFGISLATGAVGATADAQAIYYPSGIIGEGVPIAIFENSTTPSEYVEGLNQYTVNFVIPPGFSNSGENYDCTVEATGTTTTTSTTTTTTSTTTTTTTTAAPEPLYWFHLGSGVGANDYPFQQNLITGSPQYLSDNTTSTSTPEFEAVFADALANPSSYQTINSRTTIADGDQFTFGTSNAANFYWLLIPDSMGVPDLTQNARLASISNNVNDVAAQVMPMNVNGQPYKLYRVNIAAATSEVTIQYNV